MINFERIIIKPLPARYRERFRTEGHFNRPLRGLVLGKGSRGSAALVMGLLWQATHARLFPVHRLGIHGRGLGDGLPLIVLVQ